MNGLSIMHVSTRTTSSIPRATMSSMRMRVVPLAALFTLACGGAKTTPASTEAQPTILKASDIVVVDSSRVESGPVLSGSLRPKTIAQLRSQAGGRVLQVNAEQGQSVKQGEVLVTIDQAALREALLSAKAQVRSAEIARDLASRNAARNDRLLKVGAIADADAEQTHSSLSQADATLEDAKSRVRTAEEQLAYTTVRAPFTGIVSEQPVNPGDIVQMGTLVMTVVDGSLLELEATVPAEQYAAVKRGASVSFGVGSLPSRRFQGKVDRVNPAVDSQTRQIRLYVNVPNADHALVSGLFAEGRLADQSAIALTVPLNAIDSRDGTPSVRRLRGGRVEKVPVTLGLRDDVAEKVAIASGVARGDTLLAGGSLTISAGTSVRVAGSN